MKFLNSNPCVWELVPGPDPGFEVKMDKLGPLVINTDGSIARWPPSSSDPGSLSRNLGYHDIDARLFSI